MRQWQVSTLFEYSNQKRDPVAIVFYCGLIPFGLCWVVYRSLVAAFALRIVMQRLFERFPDMSLVTTGSTVRLSSSSVVTPLEVLVNLYAKA